MTSPTLLGLPRELRDIIYRYIPCLDHKVAIPHRLEVSENIPRSCLHANVVFSDFPDSSLLLVNHQLYHEYLEAPCFKSMCASYKIIQVFKSTTYLGDRSGADKRYQQLLHRTRHITVTQCSDSHSHEAVYNMDAYLDSFSKFIMYNAPHLLTFQLTLDPCYEYHVYGHFGHGFMTSGLEHVYTRKDKLGDLPARFAGLPLFNRMRGVETLY